MTERQIPQDVSMALTIIRQRAEELQILAERYDEAMKRIADLTAELEYLRREVIR